MFFFVYDFLKRQVMYILYEKKKVYASIVSFIFLLFTHPLSKEKRAVIMWMNACHTNIDRKCPCVFQATNNKKLQISLILCKYMKKKTKSITCES